MSDYGDLIENNGVGSVIAAAKQKQQQTSKNKSMNSGNHEFTAEDLKPVNMGIKVPAALRDEWMIAARRKKMKVAQIIKAALIAELGVPEGFEDLL